MNSPNLRPQQIGLTVVGHRDGPRRTERQHIDGRFGGLKCGEQQLDARLLEAWHVEHLVGRRLHGRERTATAGHAPSENVVQLRHRNEARITRADGITELRVEVLSMCVAKALGDVQHDRPQVDLWQRVSRDDVKVVAHVLVRMIQVRAVNHRHFAS